MNLPLDNNGNVAAAGTQEYSFRVRDGGAGEFFLTDGTFQEVILPTGSNCDLVYFQVQKTIKTTYDPQEDCLPFEFSYDGTEDGVLCPPEGVAVSIKKVAGKTLGFIKAEAGHKIVCYAMGEDTINYTIPDGASLFVDNDGVQITQDGDYIYIAG